MLYKQAEAAKTLLGKHAGLIDEETLRRLPDLLADPIMVIRQENGRYAILIKDGRGQDVLTVVQPGVNVQHRLKNLVVTTHPKARPDAIVRAISEGKVTYRHKERSLEWLHEAQRQLPGTVTTQDFAINIRTNEELGKPLAQPDGGTWRGSYDPVTDTIRLFESANLSTFLHEGGHRWLFEMTGDLGDGRLLPAARERITRDLQTVMEWLKIDIDVSKADPDQIKDALTVEAHETWARGVEAYLMEGKAPSAALAAVFARFRDWLIRIYRTVATLDAALSPEVRQVMDRLLASVEGQEGTERPHPSELVPVNSSEKG